MKHAFIIVSALLASACSALGLSDGLEQSQCLRCEELNAVEPPGDCQSWQCSDRADDANGMCIIDLIDADGDGAPPAECATPERPADCDDAAPTNTPGGTEICELTDNDCDGLIDEDALSVSTASVVTVGALSAMAFAPGDLESGAAYRAGGELVAVTLPFDGAAPAAATLAGAAMSSNVEATAIAPSGTDWAIAYADGSGCSRIVLGAWDGGGPTLEAVAGHRTVGLPKSGGVCPADPSAVGHPAVASVTPRQVLVAHLGVAGSRDCGAAAASVGLVVAQRTGSSGPYTSERAAPVLATESTDAIAPALIAVDPTFGYLLAYPEPGGTIGLYRIVVDGMTLDVSVTEAQREACDGECGDVALRRVGDEIALTYRRGGCDGGAAVLARFAIAGDALVVGERFTGPDVANLRFPVAARRSAPDEWVLAWTVTSGMERGLTAARISPDGTMVGETITLVTAATPQPGALLAGTGMDGIRGFLFDPSEGAIVRGAAECLAEIAP